MAEHRNLTGASLHECKGADAASADTVLVANGDGTTTWQKITSSNINSGSVFNTNKFYLTTSFADISTAEDVLVYVPVNATLTKITTILHAAIASADSVITISNSNGPTTIG